MAYQETLKPQDTLNPALAYVYILENRQRTLVMNCIDITAEIKKNKKEIKVLGVTGSKHE